MTGIHYVVLSILFCWKNRSDYVETHSQDSSFGSDAWAILSDIEQSIKTKVESIGVPLKEWNIEIFRGVLTGCNDAFIITSEKRDEILANCIDNAERGRTAELIRPILRGRDIKRYNYDWANLWLINVHNGVKDKIPSINIEDYPTLKAYLNKYWDKIRDRADKGDTPYNLRNCAYLEDFSKPKIIWKRVGSIIRFSYDTQGILGLDSTCFAVGSHIPYLCCVLNSSMGHYLLNNAPRTGTGDLLISVQAVEPIKIPPVPDNENMFELFIKEMDINPTIELGTKIDNVIFDLYGLTQEEREFISEHYH